MGHATLRTGIALLALCALASTTGAQSSGEALEVLAVKARFAQARRSGEPRHTLKLALRVSPRQLPDPDPDPEPAPSGAALKAAIVADMQNRGLDYLPSGTANPGGGFNAKTLRCPSGSLAEVVALAVPLPNSTDMFTDTAYFCRDSRQYWAHGTGGFAGFNLWIGPFTLP